jgi:Sulfatase
MKQKLTHLLKNQPWYVLLLPLFFVLHGFTENYGIVPAKDAFLLFLFYASVGIVLTGIFWLFFRYLSKAALLSFFILCIQFFFGSLQDVLRKELPNSFISRYSFILPAMAVFLIAIIILLRKKKSFSQVTFFLNCLFLLFVLVDAAQLFFKPLPSEDKAPANRLPFATCDTCTKSDVYLIVADGYSGKTSLRDLFSFDNSRFEQQLSAKGFFIVDSSISNYNYTPFSISSMLKMDYLQGVVGNNTNLNDIAICYNSIKESNTFRFFKSNGYALYNYSIFDFKDQVSLAKATFLLRQTKPITAQTFTSRVTKELFYHLVTDLNLDFAIEQTVYSDKENNELLYDLTQKVVSKNDQPKFVYTHLVLPHFPYYYDSTGKAFNIETLQSDSHKVDLQAYVSYLKYSNTLLLQLIDHIQTNSAKPPIIILISDHGFREFANPVPQKYHYSNINAVYFPNGNYKSFYKGMSNINEFRVVLNNCFQQNLPLLKDSTSWVIE